MIKKVILFREEKTTHPADRQVKTQVVVDRTNGWIICLDFVNGRKHDFRPFKESKMLFKPETIVGADTRFQGIKKFHSYSMVPNLPAGRKMDRKVS